MSVKVKVKVKVTQLCPTLCHPMDYTVHGILQARILEWVARGDDDKVDHTREEEKEIGVIGRGVHELQLQGI